VIAVRDAKISWLESRSLSALRCHSLEEPQT